MRYSIGIIVGLAVVPDELDIAKTALHSFVGIVCEIFLDSAQVHRLLDN